MHKLGLTVVSLHDKSEVRGSTHFKHGVEVRKFEN